VTIAELYQEGWNTAFEKLSKPRWVKELAEEALSPHGQKALRSLKLPTRTIKPLGEGSSQVADLAFHPEHGLSVRKIPKLYGLEPQDLEQANNAATQDYGNWQKVKDLTQGEGPFAHILGSEGPVGYFQYAKRRADDPGEALRGQLGGLIAKEKHHRSRAEGLYPTDFDAAEAEFFLSEKFNGLARDARSKLNSDVVPFSEQDSHHIAKVKSEFPKFYDYDVARNVSGGKIVDANFGDKPNIIQRLNHGQITPMTRRTWLGNKRG